MCAKASTVQGQSNKQLQSASPKARRAGVKLPVPKKGKASGKRFSARRRGIWRRLGQGHGERSQKTAPEPR